MRLKLLLLGVALLGMSAVPAGAQTFDRPMVMPVPTEAGPMTWLFGQAYGNTPGAYNFGDEWYSAGQGLHFGIDLSMPCGTPLVAVADGVVMFVDDRGFGAGPHNLIMRHDALGVTTLYGHLLGLPPVRPGQAVSQGELVAYSGTPDDECTSRPHLHFEVRSLDYQTTYNPITWIDADWHSLALVGAYSGTMFQGDMDNPSRWMSLEDQPDVRFWSQRLNNYSAAYPPGRDFDAPPIAQLNRSLPPLDTSMAWTARTIGEVRCCWQNFWHPTDPDGLYSIDGPRGQRAQVLRWTLDNPHLDTPVEAAPPSYKSSDWAWEISVEGDEAVIRHIEDGTAHRVNTGGRYPAMSPDAASMLWTIRRPTLPGQPRSESSVMVADIDGDNVRQLFSAPGAGGQWLDSERVLITLPGENRTTTLAVIDTRDDERFLLGTWSWIRGVNAGPGGEWVVFYATNQPDPEESGVYAIRTEAGAQAVKLPWFGSWRWRDRDELYVIPMDFSQPAHRLLHYDLKTGEGTTLDTPKFTVMNGDWAVSADGRRIAYRELSTWELTLLEMNGLQ